MQGHYTNPRKQDKNCVKTFSVNAGVLNGMWLHSFLLYFRQLWRNDWKNSKSIKGFLVFNYSFYYLKSKKIIERSPSRKLIRNFLIYSERCHQASLMFLVTFICHQWLERPICSSGVSFASADTISMLTSPSFLSCFYPALYCRGWESNLVLENATLLKNKYFFGDGEEKGSWSKASEFTHLV